MAAGTNHNVAMVQVMQNRTVVDHQMVAWGYNDHGQLGNGDTFNRDYPVYVLSSKEPEVRLGQVVSVYAGGNSSGALLANTAPSAAASKAYLTGNTNLLYLWGANNNYQLGDGTDTDRTLPVRVLKGATHNNASLASDSNYNGYFNRTVDLSLSNSYTMAVQDTGMVFGWNSNTLNHLPDQVGHRDTNALEFATAYLYEQGKTDPVKRYVMESQINTLPAGEENNPLGFSLNMNWNQYMRISLDNVIARMNHGFNLRNADGSMDDIKSNVADLVGSELSSNTDLFTVRVVNDYGTWAEIRPVTAANADEGTFGHGTLRLLDRELNIQSLYNVHIIPTAKTIEADNVVADKTYITSPKVVSGGNWTMALKADGTVWSWGYAGNTGHIAGYAYTNSNHYGGNYNYPIQNVGVSDMVDIATSSNGTSFGLKSDGTVWGWGNGFGNYGWDHNIYTDNEYQTYTGAVVQIGGVPEDSAVAIAASSNTLYILMRNGDVYTSTWYQPAQSDRAIYTWHWSTLIKSGYWDNVISISTNSNVSGVSFLRRDGMVLHDTLAITNADGSDNRTEDNFRRNVLDIARGSGHTLMLMEDNARIGAYGSGTNSSLLGIVGENGIIVDVNTGLGGIEVPDGKKLYITSVHAGANTSGLIGSLRDAGTGVSTAQDTAVPYIWGANILAALTAPSPPPCSPASTAAITGTWALRPRCGM